MQGFHQRHLIGLKDLTREEIETVLDTALPMRDIIQRDIKKVPALKGKAIVTVFFENSTRTRTSFETAGKYLGADVVNLNIASSSVKKGETLKDTILNIEAMGFDLMVMRHSASGAPNFASRCMSRMRLINAGDGAHEHPSQGLLDMLTIREQKGALEGLKVVILGDVMNSRVARSDIYALSKFGSEIRIAAPATLIPKEIEQMGVKTFTSVEEALEGADVINVLRMQLERASGGLVPSLDEYSARYILNEKRLRLARPDAIVMHPGPINRGVEIASNVADGPQSVITRQVTNGVAVRMAILYLMLGGTAHETLH